MSGRCGLRLRDRRRRAVLSQRGSPIGHDGIHGGGQRLTRRILRGLDRRISEETDLPVHLVDEPLECVVLGAGRCIEAFESLRVMFMEADR